MANRNLLRPLSASGDFRKSLPTIGKQSASILRLQIMLTALFWMRCECRRTLTLRKATSTSLTR